MQVVNAASQVYYTLSYDVKVQSEARIQAVTSNSHRDAIVVTDEVSTDEGIVNTVTLKEDGKHVTTGWQSGCRHVLGAPQPCQSMDLSCAWCFLRQPDRPWRASYAGLRVKDSPG